MDIIIGLLIIIILGLFAVCSCIISSIKDYEEYNISHIQLLKMIKENEIQENTLIYCSDLVCPLIYANGTLNILNSYDELVPLSFKAFIENIDYANFRIEKR